MQGGGFEAAGIRRVEVVANIASGRAGPSAGEEAALILEQAGVEAQVQAVTGPDILGALKRARDREPDLMVLIAGDGTARAAAELCGPRGPMLAPLAGGTMNMLPHALYGPLDWKSALTALPKEGTQRAMAGGEVDGHLFFVAAILGAPALFAEAREAMRAIKPLLALRRAEIALRRALSGRLRYAISGKPSQRAEALCLLCPAISLATPNESQALEAAALDLAGAREVFSLAFHALAGDWRADPGVLTQPCREAMAWATGRIPAILDGEPVRLGRAAKISFRRDGFRALALVPAKL